MYAIYKLVNKIEIFNANELKNNLINLSTLDVKEGVGGKCFHKIDTVFNTLALAIYSIWLKVMPMFFLTQMRTSSFFVFFIESRMPTLETGLRFLF